MCFQGLKLTILRVRASAGEAVLSFFFLLMLTASLSAETQAQMAPLKARSFRDRVVDRISLNDKTQVWGILLNKRPTRVLVNTSWIRTNCPDFYEKDVAASTTATGRLLLTYAKKIIEDIKNANELWPDWRNSLICQCYEDRFFDDFDL